MTPFFSRSKADEDRTVREPKRQKKMEKKLKSVNIVKPLGEGVTVPDVRDLNRDMHNIFPHLTRQRVALTLPSEMIRASAHLSS